MGIRISERAYPHRGKWRHRITEGPGIYRWAPPGVTEEEARELAEGFADGVRARVAQTVGALVEKYLDWLAEMDRKPLTLKAARNFLAMLLGPMERLGVVSVTEPRARQAYAELSRTSAAATHHAALGRARHLWKWAIRQGMAKHNPWLEVDKLGRANRGKPQLRIDEARRLADVCMARIVYDDAALGIAITQFMALRASEAAERIVRDVDDDGRLLWIPDSKTAAGKRALEIPEALRESVRLRTVGRKPGDRLFWLPSGKPLDRRSMDYYLQKYCKQAGVPVVCLHSLRGQWASIAVGSGALSHVVARELGHASFTVTKAHYATPESISAAEQAKRLEVLQRGRKPPPGAPN